MSISTLENRTSLRMLDAHGSWTARQRAAEQAVAEELMEATKKPLHFPAQFARLDHNRRVPTVAEVLTDALDAQDFTARFLQIVCDVAHGRGDRQADAMELLEEMAQRWSSFNTESVE